MFVGGPIAAGIFAAQITPELVANAARYTHTYGSELNQWRLGLFVSALIGLLGFPMILIGREQLHEGVDSTEGDFNKFPHFMTKEDRDRAWEAQEAARRAGVTVQQ